MNPTYATNCVLCGFEAMLAPRVHLRDLTPGAPAQDVSLGLCEVHGGRLRKGELRVLMVIESWLTAENRLSPSNPLHGLRLVAHCLACDAPLEVASVAAAAHTLPGGEVIVECPGCPMHNVVEAIGGDPMAVRLWQRPPRPRP